MAKIQHIAIFTDNPMEMAEFYRDVFGLKIIKRPNSITKSAWVTDGELKLALLQRNIEGKDPNTVAKGINHFGFTLTAAEKEEIVAKLKERGHKVFYPGRNRPYAELASRDIEGNRFDLSTGMDEERGGWLADEAQTQPAK